MEKLDYNSEKHEYKMGGGVVPSVTQVLKAINPFDSRFISTGKKDYYLNKGSYIHNLLQDYMNGLDIWEGLDSEDLGYIDSLANYLKNSDLENASCYIEKPMYSHNYNYAGRPDLIFYDENVIVDIKTSIETRSIYNNLQLQAYRNLVSENIGPDNWLLFNLFVKSDGTYRVKKYKYSKRDFSDFLSCLRVYNLKNKK